MPDSSESTSHQARAALQAARESLELSASHNLGLTLHDSGSQLDVAASFVSKASAGFELRLGPDHPNTLKCLHNVAMLTAAAGSLQEAAGVYEGALAARSRALGPEHPDTLKTSCNLGLTWHQLGEHAKAVEVLSATEESARRVLGPSSPVRLASAHNLALSLAGEGVGRRREGIEMLRAVWQSRREALGPTHRDTLQTCCDLGRTLAGGEAAHRTEARALLVTALEEAKGALGAAHALPRRVEAALRAVEGQAALPGAGELDEAEAEHWAAVQADRRPDDGLTALLMHVFVAPERLGGPPQVLRRDLRRRLLSAVLDAAWAAGATAVEALEADLEGFEAVLPPRGDGGERAGEEGGGGGGAVRCRKVRPPEERDAGGSASIDRSRSRSTLKI